MGHFCQILMFMAFFLANSACCCAAQVVQKWQDGSGQWHFGDASAAMGRRTVAVEIEQPISVVHNNQPLPATAAAAATTTAAMRTKQTDRQRRQSKQGKRAVSEKNLQKQPFSRLKCAEHREQLRLTRHAAQHRQRLTEYEQQCIFGRYYGDTLD